MKRVNVILAIAWVAAAAATQWGPRHLAPGVNSGRYSWPIAVTASGDFYRKDSSYVLYLHRYLGSYTWSSSYIKCTGSKGHPDAIDPSGREGFILYGADILKATSPDGVNWVAGKSLPAWNRSKEECYPARVSCAWRGGREWLYAIYNYMYDDYAIWAGPSPYSAPRSVNLGQTVVTGLSVRFTGDYMVFTSWGAGPYLDLFETKGFGASWGPRTPINEVNTSHPENYPVLGKLEGKNILFWLDGADLKIYYSVGANTPAVEPSSLGKVKALFQ
jgi:hypothetical protein